MSDGAVKKAWGQTSDRILLLLQNQNFTKVEICAKLELTHDQVSNILTRLRRSKRIYISDYVRYSMGKKIHLRPVFSLGSEPDEEKPVRYSQKERSAKAYQKRKLIKQHVQLHGWITA